MAIAGSTFLDHSALEDGGVFFNNGGGLAIAGRTIGGGVAADGGGIANRGGTLARVASDVSANEGGDLDDLT